MRPTVENMQIRHLPQLRELFARADYGNQGEWMYDPRYTLVASYDGKVVGFIAAWVNGDAYAWVDNLVVHPDHRRERVAYFLCLAMRDLLRSGGIRFVHAAIENPDLARTLKRAGFTSKGMGELLVYDLRYQRR